LEKIEVSNLKNDSTIPSASDDYKSLEKGKTIRSIRTIKRKKKTKNRIFFNSFLQNTLNPYLQALFFQT